MIKDTVTTSYDQLALDVKRISAIPVIPSILEVVCRSTGMGFAAVARVTDTKWIVCSVRDEINFGLQPGGELKLETTICNEIRQSGNEVVINHVDENEHFRTHHTPKMYGFQSYISMPIILKTGEFFGTLCAIDPNPADVENPKTIGMFKLFAELIAFHLQSQEVMNKTMQTVHDLNKELEFSQDENRQYRYISDHNLQEPLRKLRVFSSMLMNPDTNSSINQELAAKINSNAQKFSMMIKDLTHFSRLNYLHSEVELTNLHVIAQDVIHQLSAELQEKNGTIQLDKLPVIDAVPFHMEQLFYHLVSNAIKFSRENISPVIQIKSVTVTPEEAIALNLKVDREYCKLIIEDNGQGIEDEELKKIFDIFYNLLPHQSLEGFGIGLAYCRKIIHLHNGFISATSLAGKGTTFSIVLPVRQISD